MGERTMEEARLEQLHRITAERDQEYDGIKKLLEARQEAMSKREREMEEKSREIDRQEENLEKREKGLLAEEEKNAACQKDLEAQKKELEQREAGLCEKERALEKQRADVALECSILKENARNEELKATRLRMEWENKQATLERTGETSGELVDARERNRVLEQENERLRQENQRLEEEKGEILRKALGISKKAEPQKGTQEEAAEKQQGGEQKKEEQQKEITEELTAEVMHRYLKRNFSPDELSVKHAEAGDQVHVMKENLAYVFVFQEPARFDVRAVRKKTKALLQRLEEMKSSHPELAFAYDEAEGEVVVSGYFMKEMLPADLMKKVGGVSELFHKGDGYES